MKGEVPKGLIIGAVAVIVLVIGFFFWNATKPLEPDVKIPDATQFSAEDIARMKEADHAADATRGIRQ